MKRLAHVLLLISTTCSSINAQNSYPASGPATIEGITVRNNDLVLQNTSSGYNNLYLKNVSGNVSLKLDYNSVLGTGSRLLVRSASGYPLVLNDAGGNVGIGTGGPTELLQIGTSTQRDFNVRIGESATLGVTYQHAETILANNARVDGVNVRALNTQNGASAISLKWYDGIRFFTTRGAVTANQTIINSPEFEKFRITPDAGVFAEEITVKLQTNGPIMYLTMVSHCHS